MLRCAQHDRPGEADITEACGVEIRRDVVGGDDIVVSRCPHVWG